MMRMLHRGVLVLTLAVAPLRGSAQPAPTSRPAERDERGASGSAATPGASGSAATPAMNGSAASPGAIPTPAEQAATQEPVREVSGEAPYFPQPPRRLERRPLIATAEALAINGLFWLGAFALGKPYARISYDSVRDNLKSDWVWDEDAFATNQFGHPYMGALAYNAARSNGFGMFGSSVFSFASSAWWELFMETETPSINDQFFTPFGGILFGEVMHRYGRAMLWNENPGRIALAALVDPIGSFNRSALGDVWARPQPPPMFGFLSAGWAGLSADFGTADGTVAESSFARLHVGINLSYGLPIDRSFRPRRPMDHFEFSAEGDVSPDDAFFAVHTRGLLWGRNVDLGLAQAVIGVFGGYDFESPKNIRVGAASIGAGATMHVPLGERNFFQGTGVLSFIPFGAAGGNVDETKEVTERDYHRGYGSSQLLLARLARRGLGMVYGSSTNFEIDGTYFDEGSEIISFTRVGGMVALLGRHGVGVEGVFSVRRATFEDKTRDVLDSSAQLRISYVLMQDLTFGGGAAP